MTRIRSFRVACIRVQPHNDTRNLIYMLCSENVQLLKTSNAVNILSYKRMEWITVNGMFIPCKHGFCIHGVREKKMFASMAAFLVEFCSFLIESHVFTLFFFCLLLILTLSQFSIVGDCFAIVL